MSARPIVADHPHMDTVGMVLLAIGSLACLEVAALNLRGETRRPRRTAAPRPSDRPSLARLRP